jgi:hypothetical protein
MRTDTSLAWCLLLALSGGLWSDPLLANEEEYTVKLELGAGVVKSAPREKVHGRELTFTPKGGAPELLPLSSGSGGGWTLEAGYLDGGQISLLRGSVIGTCEIWRFKKTESGWVLDARGKFKVSAQARGAKFVGINKVEVMQEGRPSDVFEMTEEAMGQNPIYKKVRMNGRPLEPSGS